LDTGGGNGGCGESNGEMEEESGGGGCLETYLTLSL
jgi:hypothetical protein